jgi:hypothetical protein
MHAVFPRCAAMYNVKPLCKQGPIQPFLKASPISGPICVQYLVLLAAHIPLQGEALPMLLAEHMAYQLCESKQLDVGNRALLCTTFGVSQCLIWHLKASSCHPSTHWPQSPHTTRLPRLNMSILLCFWTHSPKPPCHRLHSSTLVGEE